MKILDSKWFPLCLGLLILLVILNGILFTTGGNNSVYRRHIRPFFYEDSLWQAPDERTITDKEQRQLVEYGHDLIVRTSYYFGPKGKIAPITNGMNCQNCHINAGCTNYGNCFSAVASTYPKYRERSGRIESIEFRINDCMTRSLNGQSIDSTGKEMKAMVAYLIWLGTEVPRKVIPKGSGLEQLPFIDRAADTVKGRIVFESSCARCHGNNGEGLIKMDSSGYIYPPLWGDHSFNTGAGMYRISRLAGFIKSNMPFELSSHDNPVLNNEQAWDVAAFISSQPRPQKSFPSDWPNIAAKPFDHPFGPYADVFSEAQHKYGPFKEIVQKK